MIATLKSAKSIPAMKSHSKRVIETKTVPEDLDLHDEIPADEESLDFIASTEFASLQESDVFSPTFAEGVLNEIDAPVLDRKLLKGMPSHLAQLCETKLLTAAQEKALFLRMNFAKYRACLLRRRVASGKTRASALHRAEQLEAAAIDDRNRIVRANTRLVISIAKKFADRKNAFDDLLSEGIGSLLRAAEKFDYARGFRFSTYATQAVRRTLYRHVNAQQLERSRVESSESAAIEEQPELDRAGNLSESRWEELRESLSSLLDRLDPRERNIIRLRFGLEESREVVTLQSLARKIGVCKERVRQIEQRAILRLREWAGERRLEAME